MSPARTQGKGASDLRANRPFYPQQTKLKELEAGTVNAHAGAQKAAGRNDGTHEGAHRRQDREPEQQCIQAAQAVRHVRHAEDGARAQALLTMSMPLSLCPYLVRPSSLTWSCPCVAMMCDDEPWEISW